MQALCAAFELPRGSYYAWRSRQQRDLLSTICRSPATAHEGVTGTRSGPGYSYTEEGHKIPDGPISEGMIEILTDEDAAYGYEKLTWRLRRRFALIINKKKVYRLCHDMELLWPQRQPKTVHPRRLPRNWIITRPNQLWQTDLKYGYVVGEDRFFYLQAVIDVCDRMIIAYHLGLTGKAADAARTLAQAVAIRQAEWVEPPVIRTDNGPPLMAQTFDQHGHPWGIEHERIPVHSPHDNASIESWHAPRERACLRQHDFTTFT